MDVEKIIASMTLNEKIAFCTGADMWHTKALKRLGIPAMKMSDGPHGLRCQEDKTDFIGINKSRPATCFPTAVTAGATWDPELYAAEGAAIGFEALASGVSVVLGPGCNIKRSPLGGRNFEYLSEDPYVSGKMAAAFVAGQQSTGASSCVKHFAANSQEYKRQNGDSRMDERTLREIYLTAFEIAVKEGRPDTVMCAYNKLNGIHCSDHKELLTGILRQEWGFDGTVITDWGATHNRIAGFRAGCDLDMPGGHRFMHKDVLRAVRDGSLQEQDVDASVRRVLRLVKKSAEQKKVSFDLQAHHALALEIARQGAVLLKNQDNILPINPNEAVLIGYMAEDIRYQGTGSSHVNPTRVVQLTQAMPDTPYIPCCDSYGEVTPESLAQAVCAAKAHKVAVVVAGLPTIYESEAFDRANMALPEGHNRMIEAVAQVNSNTVVVLLGGGPMELPWEKQVRGILYMGLPGQAGGQAIADLLTGVANPSGKLTESWPYTYTDVVCRDTFGQRNPEYREGIYVGYRYYETAKKEVRYPFGHGLSYTGFTYSHLNVTPKSVSVQVENTGTVAGREVVQVYIAPPRGGIHRPAKELKGFAKVPLEPGQRTTVTIPLDSRSFALWQDGWVVPEGTYTVMVGASCQDIRCQDSIFISGSTLSVPQWQKGSWYETLRGLPDRKEWEMLMGGPAAEYPPLKKGTYTLDNTLLEMQEDAAASRMLYRLVRFAIVRAHGKNADSPECRMLVETTADCPLRGLVISGKGLLTDGMVKAILRLSNGKKRK